MAERIAEMGVPPESLTEFYNEIKRGEPLTDEIKNELFDKVFDIFYANGLIDDNDFMKLTFFPDPEVSLDSYERTVYLYDAHTDEDGKMYPGELIAESSMTVMPDQFN